ncbi:hypothetical protein L0F63_002467 [Massospora cicadina]|nr:hypothetical protein L0F63_002467 [Massospora cicadina]
MAHALTPIKREAWDRAKLLSASEAQERYFSTVVQDRPHIADIIRSLERGRRMDEIIGTFHLEGSLCEPKVDPSLVSDIEGAPSVSSNIQYNDSLRMLQTSSFSYDASEECSDGSSDDGCDNSNSPAPRLNPEVEKALESLQTQVAALNERLELMRQQLDCKNVSVSKPYHSGGWRLTAVGFLKKAVVILLVMAFINVKAYRNGQAPTAPYFYGFCSRLPRS